MVRRAWRLGTGDCATGTGLKLKVMKFLTLISSSVSGLEENLELICFGSKMALFTKNILLATSSQPRFNFPRLPCQRFRIRRNTRSGRRFSDRFAVRAKGWTCYSGVSTTAAPRLGPLFTQPWAHANFPKAKRRPIMAWKASSHAALVVFSSENVNSTQPANNGWQGRNHGPSRSAPSPISRSQIGLAVGGAPEVLAWMQRAGCGRAEYRAG